MYYVEEVLDKRFIAINDMVDTGQEDNEIVPFKSVPNEYYARGTSKRITALSGSFTGSFAPYGYQIDPENKQKLIIGSETAPIVKWIFQLSKEGNSTHQIARMLCKDGVLIPRAYRAKKKAKVSSFQQIGLAKM